MLVRLPGGINGGYYDFGGCVEIWWARDVLDVLGPQLEGGVMVWAAGDLVEGGYREFMKDDFRRIRAEGKRGFGVGCGWIF